MNSTTPLKIIEKVIGINENAERQITRRVMQQIENHLKKSDIISSAIANLSSVPNLTSSVLRIFASSSYI